MNRLALSRFTGTLRRHVLAGVLLLASLAASAAPAAAQGGEVIEYYGVDAIGSIRVVFDVNGNVLARNDYVPFGESFTPSGPLPSEQFTGQARDGEAGLDYFGARFYQPRHGRFSAPDPVYAGMGNPQHWNRYAYVLNTPLTLVDPTGMIPCQEDAFGSECINGTPWPDWMRPVSPPPPPGTFDPGNNNGNPGFYVTPPPTGTPDCETTGTCETSTPPCEVTGTCPPPPVPTCPNAPNCGPPPPRPPPKDSGKVDCSEAWTLTFGASANLTAVVGGELGLSAYVQLWPFDFGVMGSAGGAVGVQIGAGGSVGAYSGAATAQRGWGRTVNVNPIVGAVGWVPVSFGASLPVDQNGRATGVAGATKAGIGFGSSVVKSYTAVGSARSLVGSACR